MAIRRSVIAALSSYVGSIARGTKSIAVSFSAAFPYLINVRSVELRKEVTEQYPDPVSSRSADDLPPRTRGLLFNDIERCTGCKECEVICPVRCITVEVEPGADIGKTWISVFDIDFSRCIYCGLCVEACIPASLVQTRQFEGAVYSLTDLVASFGRGHVTNEQREKWARRRQEEQGLSTGGSR